MNYRYTLDGRSRHRKFTCPQCNRRSLNRYYDPETGDYYPSEIVGKCDHANTCNYHLPPRDHSQSEQTQTPTNYKPLKFTYKRTAPPQRRPPEDYHYFSPEFMEKTLSGYGSNNLVKFLSRLFGEQLSGYLIRRYKIGTANYLPGSPVLWYLGYDQRITAGKVIYYPDPITGERYKADSHYNGKPAVNWVHTIMKIPEFNKRPCFFGEHLLSQEPGKPVLIVESEKTALITSIFFPDHVSLATGSVQISDRLYWEYLRDRKAIMIPDFSNGDTALTAWREKAQEFNRIFKTSIEVIDLKDQIGETERVKGLDIADLLTMYRDPEQGFILYDNSHPIYWEFTTEIIEGKEVLKRYEPDPGYREDII